MNALPARSNRVPASANDRLRQRFTARLWSWTILATGLHFSAFALWPELTAPDFSVGGDAPRAYNLPPDIPLPAPPEPRARPATPVLAPVDAGDDLTIARTTLEANPVPDAPPPPPSATRQGEATRMVPYTVRPEILNVDEVRRRLARLYPPALRDAGLGGTVELAVLVGEDGRVQQARVGTSSGYAAFDEAAIALSEVLRFSPALNRDQRVAVWVSFPVVFESRRRAPAAHS